MKNSIFLFLLLLSGMVDAAEQEVILSVAGINCPVCPITIKKSLQKVEGVKSVNVIYESKTATVLFDDKLTDIKNLLEATKNAGYPSTLKELKK